MGKSSQKEKQQSLAVCVLYIWSSTLTLRWQFEVNYVSFTVQQRVYSSLHLCLWKACNNSDLITQTVQPLSQLDFAWKLHISGHSFGCSPKPHTVNSCAVFHSGCTHLLFFCAPSSFPKPLINKVFVIMWHWQQDKDHSRRGAVGGKQKLQRKQQRERKWGMKGEKGGCFKGEGLRNTLFPAFTHIHTHSLSACRLPTPPSLLLSPL